jgi:hypothetical protein
MNNAYIDVYTPIFETLQELTTRERHMHTIEDKINPV